MKFLVNLTVDLSIEEIQSLRKYFKDVNQTFNIYFYSKSVTIFRTLSSKSIITIDNIGNAKLTPIGRKIFDQLDRDKKINQILDE